MGIRLEVIQFFDESNQTLVERVPQDGSADVIYGAQLADAAEPEAVFFRDGKDPGRLSARNRHTLTTANAPVLTHGC